jgi:hypothetical protein
LTHSKYSGEQGTLKKFNLRVLIRALDPNAQDGPGWAWAYVRPRDWWKMMNELIEENPDVQVGVFIYGED